jgi:hypothetical protein
MEAYEMLLKLLLCGKQNAEVAEIVSSRAGDECVAKRGEERESVEGGECRVRTEAAAAGASRSGRIDEGAGGGTVAVGAVAAGGEADNWLVGELLFEEQSAGEGELLIATSGARRAIDADGDFTTREKAAFAAGVLTAMREEATHEVCGSLIVGPMTS